MDCRNYQIPKRNLTIMLKQIVLALIVQGAVCNDAADAPANTPTRFEDWMPCSQTSLELRTFSDYVAPCIIEDLKPPMEVNSTITLVMVTDHSCGKHRDGAALAAEVLNQNAGSSLRLGLNEDFIIGFRFVSVVAGNSQVTPSYLDQHEKVLRAAILALEPQYIIGTCSGIAKAEKQAALDTQTILLAAVGPPSFYDPLANPYVFGIHLNSDDYPLDAVRRLSFLGTQSIANVDSILSQEQNQQHSGNSSERYFEEQPIRVIYRTQSEFFYSTCQSAIDSLRSAGFQNIETFLYDPAEDADGDGEINQLDVDFLNSIADQACPKERDQDPALFICSLSEHNVFLQRFQENECRPLSVWLTAATWIWALDNLETVPYFQGGGQWHESLDYGDEFFPSGSDMLLAMEQRSGYYADYDSVAEYSSVQVVAAHLRAFYKTVASVQDPVIDFRNNHEQIRRRLGTLTAHTLFGRITFDGNQRNDGRLTAASQWLPPTFFSSQDGEAQDVKLSLVSPILQAEAAVVIPSPTARNCPAGMFVNASRFHTDPSLLSTKCSFCPIDTYTAGPNSLYECNVCPDGTSTNSTSGAFECILYDDQFLGAGVLAFGYSMMSISICLAFIFMVWVAFHRRDPVVMLAQGEYLVLICVGVMISSSSIFALGFEAGTGDSFAAATRACQAVPFLYNIGWVLQYGSLTSKTFRLYRVMQGRANGAVVSIFQSARIVLVCSLIDITLCLSWYFHSPLEYVRQTTYSERRDDLLVIQTRGSCQADMSSVWFFVGPLLFHHAAMMISTCYFLCRVRSVHSRYQESTYMALASLFVLEVLVIGVAVWAAARESIRASFIVQVGIIAFADIGVTCFIFLPKIFYQMQGLEEGVGIGESVLRESHKKAVQRERQFRGVIVSQQAVVDPESDARDDDSIECAPTYPKSNSSVYATDVYAADG